VAIGVTKKLAPQKEVDTLVYISKLKDDGEVKIVASERNPNQPPLFDDKAMTGGAN